MKISYTHSFKSIIVMFLLASVFLYSCGDDDEALPQDEEIISRLLTDSLLNIVEEFNIDINRGTNPPNLENTYYVAPRILENSNRPSDNIGMGFVDLTFQVTEQNDDDLTFAFFGREGSIGNSTGQGGFIIGEGNFFTIFVEETSVYFTQRDSAKILNLYSGELVEGGIQGYKQLVILTEDYGDPNEVFIEIGESRLVVDSDGFSPIVNDDLTGGRRSSQLNNSEGKKSIIQN